MNGSSKTVLSIALVVAVALLLLLGGWAITGTTMIVEMMGNGTTESGTTENEMMGGIGMMWIPVSLMTGLVVLLVWAIFRHKK